MRSSGGAAIPMQQELKNKIKYLVGDEDMAETVHQAECREPFSEEIVDFLDMFSRMIRKDREAREYPDIQTYGFWCRKASILEMKQEYCRLEDRIGRGMTFHIAPSNIPMMFLFSLTVSLLAGNPNVVRISSREFVQTGIVCRILRALLAEPGNEWIRRMILILQYPHDDRITEGFSERCRNRIIWGGDASISKIRETKLSPWAIDLPFYDRFSLSVIQADEYLKAENPDRIALDFYNDTYVTDQNACTSPQLVVWMGKQVNEARERFWRCLNRVVLERYPFQDIQAVDKLAAACRFAISHEEGRLIRENMALCRMELDRLPGDLSWYRCPGGYFYEYHAKNLDEIGKICSVDTQTISCFGIKDKEILSMVKRNHCMGVDRVVPVGDTMDFGLQWDGFDFIYSLTRVVG